MMYEIWSLGHKPFEDEDGREVHITYKIGVEEAILHWSGKSFKHEQYMCGKQDYPQNLENLVYECTGPIVRSMLMLRVSGGMPPRRILKNRCSEIEFRSILGS